MGPKGYKTVLSKVGASLALALVLCPQVGRSSPFSFSYGGRLADQNDAPIVGPVDLEFKFYPVATGGDPVGISPQVFSQVTLVDGVFQVDFAMLPAELHTVFGLADTWIEVTDKTHHVVYPRQKMAAVPYALKVPVDGTTVTYDGNGLLTTVAGGGVSNSNIADGTINQSKISGLQTALSGKQDAITTSSVVNGGGFASGNQVGMELKPYGAGAGATGELHFNELAANGANYVAFKAPDSLTGNVVFKLPSADGAANTVLATDGSGQLSFRTVPGLGGTVDLTSSVSNTLPVANGGTGATSFMTNGVLFGSGGSALSVTAAAGAYQVLQANGSGVPTFGALDLSQGSSTTNTLPITRGGTGTSSTSQSYVFAGPVGSSGAPSFRALAASDLPVMTGATSGSSGVKGIVPLPVAGDDVKFLRGDASWASVPTPTAAGASGQLQFNNSSAFGGASGLYWDSVNSRLGVGTSSPMVAFDVNGPARALSFSAPGGGTSSEHFGAGSSTSSYNYATAIGNTSTAQGQHSTALGYNSYATGTNSLALGDSATNSGSTDEVAVGTYASTSGGYTVALGGAATSQGGSVALGYGAANTGAYSTAVGMSTQAGADGIALGAYAVAGSSQLVVGSATHPVTKAVFGNGVVSSSPANVTISSPSASGSNIAGSDLILASGYSTGSAPGGMIKFQTSPSGSSGSTANSLATRMVIDGGGNVGIGTAAPSAKLEVQGDIRSNSSFAVLAGGSDKIRLSAATGPTSSGSCAGWGGMNYGGVSGSSYSCTVSFSQAFTAAPICTCSVQQGTAALCTVSSPSASSITVHTFTTSGSATAATVAVHCMGPY